MVGGGILEFFVIHGIMSVAACNMIARFFLNFHVNSFELVQVVIPQGVDIISDGSNKIRGFYKKFDTMILLTANIVN
jgi:hypothetical protein